MSTLILEELNHRKMSPTEELRYLAAESVGIRFGTQGSVKQVKVPYRDLRSLVLQCATCGSWVRLSLAEDRQGLWRCPVCGEGGSFRVEGGQVFVGQSQRKQHGQADESSGARTGRTGQGREEQKRFSTGEGDRSMNVRTAREVLGLSERFTAEELRRARRSLMQQFHPDKFATSPPRVQAVMEAEFKRVDSAYQRLSQLVS